MLAAQGELLVFTDADMATPPDQLPLLVAALQAVDVALGSRIQPDGSDMRATQPRFRRIVGRVFRLAAQIWVTGLVRDTQCGFKGFRREVAVDLFGRLQIISIVFDVDLIYLARRRGYRIGIVPIVWADRRGSRMQARPMLALRVAWDLVRIRFVHGSISKVAATGKAAPKP
jgi:dolichyl-phosphate beta-glucosyltransferase